MPVASKTCVPSFNRHNKYILDATNWCESWSSKTWPIGGIVIDHFTVPEHFSACFPVRCAFYQDYNPIPDVNLVVFDNFDGAGTSVAWGSSLPILSTSLASAVDLNGFVRNRFSPPTYGPAFGAQAPLLPIALAAAQIDSAYNGFVNIFTKFRSQYIILPGETVCLLAVSGNIGDFQNWGFNGYVNSGVYVSSAFVTNPLKVTGIIDLLAPDINPNPVIGPVPPVSNIIRSNEAQAILVNLYSYGNPFLNIVSPIYPNPCNSGTPFPNLPPGVSGTQIAGFQAASQVYQIPANRVLKIQL